MVGGKARTSRREREHEIAGNGLSRRVKAVLLFLAAGGLAPHGRR